MNSEKLQISRRMPQAKARRLRREGYIPGVLYDNNQYAIPVVFNRKKVEGFLRGLGNSVLFEVSLDNETYPVRIREIQRDPVTNEVIHIDMQKVKGDQRIKAEVPLKFEGMHEVKRRGLILQHQKNTLEVEGLPRDIPPYIKVPVHLLGKKHSIRVLDLAVSKELSVIDSPEAVVALAVNPSREEVPNDTPEHPIDEQPSEAAR